MTYSQRDSWEKMVDCGRQLIEKFITEELPRVGEVASVEKPFELNISTLQVPLVGIIDLGADIDGKKTVTDFKTSGSAYEDHEVVLSDQLTGYQLAERKRSKLRFASWSRAKSRRSSGILPNGPEQMVEFLAKATYVAGEIASERFYKRSGKWCPWCDYLSVCTGGQENSRRDFGAD
jgi:hypothetical protein